MGCPEPVEALQGSKQTAQENVGLVFGAYMIIYIFTGMLVAHCNRWRQHLRRRELKLIYVACFGWVIHAVAVPLSHFFGKDKFPCGLLLFCLFFSFALVASSGLISLMVFKYKTQYHELIQRATFDQIKRLQGVGRRRTRKTTRSGQSASSSRKSSTTLARRFINIRNNGRADGIVVKKAISGNYVTGNGEFKQVRKSENASKFNDEQMMEALEKLAYRSSHQFATHMEMVSASFCLLCLCVRIFGGKITTCSGCGIDNLFYDYLVLLVAWIVYLCIMLQQHNQLRKIKVADPFGVIAESKKLLGIVFLICIFYVLHIADVASDAAFTFDLFVSICGVLYVFVMTYRQVYESKLETVERATQDINDFLNNPDARVFFNAYLVQEYCFENLKFYTQVQEWKKAYFTTPKKERKQEALEIFRVFVSKNQAVLEINIPSTVKESIIECLAGEDLRDVPIDVFDQAVDEVVHLMRPSFDRFMKSQLYRQYLGVDQEVESEAPVLSGQPHVEITKLNAEVNL